MSGRKLAEWPTAPSSDTLCNTRCLVGRKLAEWPTAPSSDTLCNTRCLTGSWLNDWLHQAQTRFVIPDAWQVGSWLNGWLLSIIWSPKRSCILISLTLRLGSIITCYTMTMFHKPIPITVGKITTQSLNKYLIGMRQDEVYPSLWFY